MNFLHPFHDGEERSQHDLEIVRLEPEELNKMSLVCLKCPRLFPRRSNWVQHLNYAHRIRIEMNTASAVKRRDAQLENVKEAQQDLLPQSISDTEMDLPQLIMGEEEASVESSLMEDVQESMGLASAVLDASDEQPRTDDVMADVQERMGLASAVVDASDEQPRTDDVSSLITGNTNTTRHSLLLSGENSGIMVFTRDDIPAAKFKSHLLKPSKTFHGIPKVKKQRERVDETCPECGKFFKYRSVFEDHVLKHSEPKPYKCTECTYQTDSTHGLKAHLQTHGIGEKYQCSGCDKMFYNLYRLLKHEKTHQQRERCHQCEICQKAFMEEAVLLAHKKSHFKQLTQCELCGKKISKQRIKQHMNLHTAETVYPCELCDTVYRQKRSLEAHLKFKHGEGLDFTEKHVCRVCNQQFANHVTLDKHMLRHNEDNKKFTCSQCGQGFYTKAEVCNHEMTHLDPYQRPYVCSICLKTFTKEHSLKAHQLVHNPSKPLKCEMCGKGFRWKNKLKEHMRTHTGERPFKCRYCESMFADCATRRYHEKKYHSDKAPLPSASTKKFTNNDIRSANIQHTGDGHIIISRGSGTNAEYIITNERDFNQKYGLLTETSELEADTTVVLDATHGSSESKLIKVEPEECSNSLEENLHSGQLVAVSAVDLEDSTNYIITDSTSHTHNLTRTSSQIQALNNTTTSASDATTHFVIDNSSLKEIDGETKLIISDQMGGAIENIAETRYVLAGDREMSGAEFLVPEDSEQGFVIAEGDYKEKYSGNEEFVVSEEKVTHLLEEDAEQMGMLVQGVNEQYIQLVDGDNQQVQFVVQSGEN